MTVRLRKSQNTCWLYLAVILDLHSRRVVGWAVSDRMKKELAIRALDMAVRLRQMIGPSIEWSSLIVSALLPPPADLLPPNVGQTCSTRTARFHDIYAMLEEQILDVERLQWVPDVHHDHEPDRFG